MIWLTVLDHITFFQNAVHATFHQLNTLQTPKNNNVVSLNF